MIDKLSKLARQFAAGFMSVWLSGVVLLLCCADMKAAPAQAEMDDPAHMSVHCDKMAKAAEQADDESRAVGHRSSELDNDCCAFLPMLFDKKRTVEGKWQMAVVTPVAVVEMSRPSPEVKSFTLVYSYRPRPLSRDGTYLKNRTFRI